MRKLNMFEHISLDGVIQVRGSGEDGAYPYGGWTAPHSVARSSICCLAVAPTISSRFRQGAEQSYV